MAQVDLGTRQNRHRPLAELTPMAAAVLQAVATRLRQEGRLMGTTSGRLLSSPGGDSDGIDVRVAQRPPFDSLMTGSREPWASAGAD
jgi:hypothetical protein